MAQADSDVIIVGAGPSGLTMAAELAGAGARVTVLEKRTGDPVSRAGTLLPRPLDLFDARGIADRFIRRMGELTPAPLTPWHQWGGMSPVPWRGVGSRFEFTLTLAQHETEAILSDWVEEQGVEILFRHEVTAIEDRPDGVAVSVLGPDGNTQVHEGQYVIGADGGRSVARECAGIDFSAGHDPSFTGVIATAKLEFPWTHVRVGRNEHGFTLIYPFGVGLTRFVVVHAETRHKGRSEPVTVSEVVKCVSQILEEEISFEELDSASRYDDTQHIANTFRSGRVFLVGESSRVCYPASGVGMNHCIQDAFNLGWKMAAVVTGRADAKILDSYNEERRPISERFLKSANGQLGVQYNFSPEGLALFHRFQEQFLVIPELTEQLRGDLQGTEFPYPVPDGSHRLAGTPAYDLELVLRDGHTVRLYELLRDRQFVLLDFSPTQELSDLASMSPSMRVVGGYPVRPHASLDGVQAMLVRPDTYVTWASDRRPAESDVAAALGQWLRLD